MAPVGPPAAGRPGGPVATGAAPRQPTIEPPAAEVSDQLASARITARKRAVQQRKSQRTLVAAMLTLFLAVAALGIGYATGIIRFGAERVATKQNGSGADAVLEDNKSRTATGDDAFPAPKRPAESSRPVADPFPKVPPGKVKPAQEPEQPLDPAQVARFESSLRDARQALGERQYQQARQRIADARKIAVSDEQKQLADGFQALSTYVEDFWQAVRQGLSQLETAGELKIGKTIASVVEVGPNHLLIREAGENRRYSVDQLPAQLAVAIAMHWLDNRPANKLYVGAFHFVGPPVDLSEAKRLWEQAASEGIDAGGLIALLPFASKTD